MDRPTVLFTIGYEGSDLDTFIARLEKSQIERVVDVREIPFSRKPGFSRTPLREKLEQEGIEYVHIQQLGSPKAIRSKLKEDEDYESFFHAFSTYLNDNQFAIEEAYRHVLEATCCLMCFERMPDKCHRSMVAEKIRQRDGNGLKVINI
ncbi:MAG: DUF488 domain-containing protein [Candidatus Saganbacteria bacterium]|nr:DUF488 domain-containing protein [Candidatus Saganbacteria bacterium]